MPPSDPLTLRRKLAEHQDAFQRVEVYIRSSTQLSLESTLSFAMKPTSVECSVLAVA